MLEYAISFKNVLEMYRLDPADIHGSIISSVVPPVTNIVRDAAKKITGQDVVIIGPGVKTGINILMDNPAQLGSDLVANAVAGIAEYKAPLVIIDIGTATTISVVDKKQNYIGGMILPGHPGFLRFPDQPNFPASPHQRGSPEKADRHKHH